MKQSKMVKSLWVQGGNLRDAMLRDPQPIKWYGKGKVIARDIAQALAFLHRHDMVSSMAIAG